jgi:chaperone BCS1
MMTAPTESIILLEDIDSAFVKRDKNDLNKPAYDGLSQVTFSGLLNALDGVASAEGRIVFMTTNYIERLDAALIRPSRVDMKEYIGYASSDQVLRAFQKFYPYADSKFANEFVNKVEKYKQPLSMAQLQGYFLFHKDSYVDAIKNLDEIIKNE